MYCKTSELIVTDVEVAKTLFVTTVVGDFRDISSFLLLLFLALATCGWNGISFNCGGAKLFTSSLVTFLLFFFPGLLKGLFGLRALFGLIGLIFSL